MKKIFLEVFMEVRPYPMNDFVVAADNLMTHVKPADSKVMEQQFTTIDIEKIKQEHFAMGKDIALQEIKGKQLDFQQNLMSLFESVKDQLKVVRSEMIAHNKNIAQDVIELSIGIAKKVIGSAVSHSGFDLIKSFLLEYLPHLKSQQLITIKVSEQYLDILQDYVTDLSSSKGLDIDVTFIYDAKMPPGDCSIETVDGKISINRDKIMMLIEKALHEAYQEDHKKNLAAM